MQTLSKFPVSPAGEDGWPWTEVSSELPRTMPDGPAWPRISIVTPSYNQGMYIEETLRSVLLQGYPNLEYFVMDGGSTDDSVDIIRKYDPWLTGWVSEKDRGQSHAINKGFAKCSGQILGWLNSDDFFLPGALFHVAEAWRKYPDAAAWVGHCRRIGADHQLINIAIPRKLSRDNFADWYNQGYFMQPSCFFTKTAYNIAGPLDENLHLVFDIDLWLSLATVGNFVLIAEELSAARIHEEAKTQARTWDMAVEKILVQSKHGYYDLARAHLMSLIYPPDLRTRLKRAWLVSLDKVLGRHA